MTLPACFSCDRERADPSLMVVVAQEPPQPICAACFGALSMRISLSAGLGCAGCDALAKAITELLDQAEAGSQLPLIPNPQVPHEPGRCLLQTNA